MEKIAIKYTIEGFVQGVGFRYFAQRNAKELQICGYTKNLNNGNVEVLAIGDNLKLEQFKNLLQKGPSRSNVNRIIEEITILSAEYYSFYII